MAKIQWTLFCITNSIFFTELSVTLVHLHYIIVRPGSCSRDLAFPDLGESTVIAAHFVDDPLDLVDPLVS